LNIGRLVRGDLSKGFVPPIASAVLDLLEKHGKYISFYRDSIRSRQCMQNTGVVNKSKESVRLSAVTVAYCPLLRQEKYRFFK